MHNSRRDAEDRHLTLHQWQLQIREICYPKDAFLGPEVLWLQMLKEASVVSEMCRRQRYADLFPSTDPPLGRMLFTLFRFCNEMNIRVDDVMWHKYPGICPYCAPIDPEIIQQLLGRKDHYRSKDMPGDAIVFQECRCDLQSYGDYDEMRVTSFRSERACMPHGLIDWQTMVDGIYGIKYRRQSVENAALHLFEELGEVAGEILSSDYDTTRDEVADVFGWICSLSTRAALALPLSKVIPVVDELIKVIISWSSGNPRTW
jgi:NTP pyrophosphatase (non-canonical NTP hydrolase)